MSKSDIPCGPILVTGATGWLGSALVGVLTGKAAELGPATSLRMSGGIRTLSLSSDSVDPVPDVESMKGNLMDERDCRRFCDEAAGATLFHCAGVIHPARTQEFNNINVVGARNLLCAAERAGVRRVVVVSSNSPFGCNPHPDHLFDEDSPYNPYRGYGRSKMLMEEEARLHMTPDGMEIVIVRAPWFYGPPQPARQTRFFEMVSRGCMPVAGRGENLRSMVYIDNLVQGLLLAANTRGAANRTFWIADERPYAFSEIIGAVEKALAESGFRCAGHQIHLPNACFVVAGWADALTQAVGYYSQELHVLSEVNKTIACSIATSRRELGYRPVIGLEEGMRRSVRWCVENGLMKPEGRR